MAATAKHFPGFGAAPANTDLGAVRIAVGLRELRAVDRPPFAAADPRRRRPGHALQRDLPGAVARARRCSRRAWCSASCATAWASSGVTISDDLEAPAFAPRGGASGAALAATRAGVDLLLFARTYDGADRAARALAGGLRSGRVDRGALEAVAGAACSPCARALR